VAGAVFKPTATCQSWIDGPALATAISARVTSGLSHSNGASTQTARIPGRSLTCPVGNGAIFAGCELRMRLSTWSLNRSQLSLDSCTAMIVQPPADGPAAWKIECLRLLSLPEALVAGVLLFDCSTAVGQSGETRFVAPPRTIADRRAAAASGCTGSV